MTIPATTARPAPARIDALDGLRGLALMGILVLNLPGYAWPGAAPLLGPDLPGAGGIDRVAWTISFILFDGKMRGLFALLFGASMALMIDRASARGDDGVGWQKRRLGWLALFGALHFILLWYGDILFSYAVLGLVVLAMAGLRARVQVAVALALLAAGMLIGWLSYAPLAELEAAAASPAAGDATRAAWDGWREAIGLGQTFADEVAATRGGWGSAIAHRVDGLDILLFGPLTGATDVLPMMLLGMAGARTGWLDASAALRCRRLALVAVPVGIGAFAMMAVWLATRDHRLSDMVMTLLVWSAVPRAVLTVGYAAAGMLLLRRFATLALVRRLADAGRMALSNYLGMSLLMVPLFAIDGARLYARVPGAGLWLAILAGWAIMLGASSWWLARHAQGPAEWLWRRLARPPERTGGG